MPRPGNKSKAKKYLRYRTNVGKPAGPGKAGTKAGKNHVRLDRG